jgi:hypothetical protein
MRRNIRWKSTILLVFFYLSSALAVYCNLIGQFDPVATAHKFLESGDRDRALDTARFGLDNHLGDEEELKQIQGRATYTTAEKIRDIFWTGAVKGDVENVYSGMGTLAADLLIIGDVRDLTIQAIKGMKGEEVDKIVAGLSAVGVGTSVAGVTGVGAIADAGLSLVKNGAKYLKKFGGLAKHSILKSADAGKQLSKAQWEKIWRLFKHTDYNLPASARVLAKIEHIDDLKPAEEIMSSLKGGGAIFLDQAGTKGLKAYGRAKKVRGGNFFLNSFKRNPSGTIGLSRFHAALGGIKFVKKEGILNTILVAVSSVGMALALLPAWAVWGIFGLTSLLLVGRVWSWSRSYRRPAPEEMDGPSIEFPQPEEKKKTA